MLLGFQEQLVLLWQGLLKISLFDTNSMRSEYTCILACQNKKRKPHAGSFISKVIPPNKKPTEWPSAPEKWLSQEPPFLGSVPKQSVSVRWRCFFTSIEFMLFMCCFFSSEDNVIIPKSFSSKAKALPNHKFSLQNSPSPLRGVASF